MKSKIFFFLFILSVLTLPSFAQHGVSVEAEIQNYEKAAASKNASAEERHSALLRLARLRQLSGDIEGAAKNWLEAAAAVPGKVDDNALLSCAYCLAAMGEWDRAGAALEPLLSKNLRARFLDISIKAVKTGDVSALAAISEKDEYALFKSEIYFMLWKIARGVKEDAASQETWQQRLIAEYPQTPEGRLAAKERAQEVTVRPSPFWFFMGGYDSLSIVRTEKISAPAAPAVSAAPAVKTETVTTSQKPAAAETPKAAAAKLQTGIFSKQENAASHMANLRQAGFSPSLEQRGDKWAVTVAAGPNPSRTIKELKNSGFDSFPVK